MRRPPEDRQSPSAMSFSRTFAPTASGNLKIRDSNRCFLCGKFQRLNLRTTWSAPDCGPSWYALIPRRLHQSLREGTLTKSSWLTFPQTLTHAARTANFTPLYTPVPCLTMKCRWSRANAYTVMDSGTAMCCQPECRQRLDEGAPSNHSFKSFPQIIPSIKTGSLRMSERLSIRAYLDFRLLLSGEHLCFIGHQRAVLLQRFNCGDLAGASFLLQPLTHRSR